MKPHFYVLFFLLFILAACKIEGGVPTPTVASFRPPTSVATPVPTEPPVTKEFRFGLLDQPENLLPYLQGSTEQSSAAPLTELLFPAPLLALNYGYTTTGVLTSVPSLENGGVELRKINVYLDQTGNITTSQTEVITQRQQIVVTYHWNPKLRWSDGVTVTAKDSVFAYKLAQKVNLGEDAQRNLALLEKYEAVDDFTTRAYLKPDFTDAAYFLTYWTPLPSHLLTGTKTLTATWASSKFAKKPVGYGPYMLDKREGDTIRLKRNPYYAEKELPVKNLAFVFLPNVDALRVSVLNGGLDLAVAQRIEPEQLAFLNRDHDLRLLNVSYVPNPVWEHLDFNLDEPLFQNILVRRAIAYGTNRQAMAEKLFAGRIPVLHSWILPGQWAATAPDLLLRYPYDRIQANVMLDEAGLKDKDGDGIREFRSKPISITLLTTSENPLRAAIAEQFRKDMGAMGIGINVKAISTEVLYRPDGPLFRRTFQVAQFAWVATPNPGGVALWGCKAVPSVKNNWRGSNFAGWCFLEADKAIRLANTSLDRAERQASYLRQQLLFTQELPVLPLFQRLSVTLSKPDLRGLEPDPLAPITWNLAKWSRN